MIYNSYYNTFPCIVHCHYEEKYNKLLWKKIKNIKIKTNIPEDVTIVTWNNGLQKRLIELQLDELKINYITLGKNVKEVKYLLNKYELNVHKPTWNNRIKLILLLRNIEKIKTNYILGLDCFDTFIVNDLSNIVEKFKKKNTKLLFNASNEFHPPNNKDEQIENQMASGPFSYFNGGVFFGLKNYICETFSDVNWDLENWKCSEQYLIRKKYHLEFPNIQIDWSCDLFQIVSMACGNINNYVQFKKNNLML